MDYQCAFIKKYPTNMQVKSLNNFITGDEYCKQKTTQV